MSNLKPGQKFATPTPGFGDRVFYETLYRQRPDSVMAQDWCVHYGVLPEDEAERVFQKMLARKGVKGTGTEITSSSAPPKKPTTSSSKKRKLEKDISVEADLQISGSEQVGSSSML